MLSAAAILYRFERARRFVVPPRTLDKHRHVLSDRSAAELVLDYEEVLRVEMCYRLLVEYLVAVIPAVHDMLEKVKRVVAPRLAVKVVARLRGDAFHRLYRHFAVCDLIDDVGRGAFQRVVERHLLSALVVGVERVQKRAGITRVALSAPGDSDFARILDSRAQRVKVVVSDRQSVVRSTLLAVLTRPRFRDVFGPGKLAARIILYVIAAFRPHIDVVHDADIRFVERHAVILVIVAVIIDSRIVHFAFDRYARRVAVLFERSVFAADDVGNIQHFTRFRPLEVVRHFVKNNFTSGVLYRLIKIVGNFDVLDNHLHAGLAFLERYVRVLLFKALSRSVKPRLTEALIVVADIKLRFVLFHTTAVATDYGHDRARQCKQNRQNFHHLFHLILPSDIIFSAAAKREKIILSPRRQIAL